LSESLNVATHSYAFYKQCEYMYITIYLKPIKMFQINKITSMSLNIKKNKKQKRTISCMYLMKRRGD